ncbi:MAG: hypothetical protein ACFE8J_19260 [Candidatus Heimdallarchaeota archaeon]
MISFVPYYEILSILNENFESLEDVNAFFWVYFEPGFGPFIASGLLILIGRFAKR